MLIVCIKNFEWKNFNQKFSVILNLKIKFLIILKLNFNGGQFYKKILNFGYF